MKLDFAASMSWRFLAAFPASAGATLCQMAPRHKTGSEQRKQPSRVRQSARKIPQAAARSRRTEPYKNVSRETFLSGSSAKPYKPKTAASPYVVRLVDSLVR